MRRDIELPQGTIAVTDEGEGAPIVFLHGLLADGRLWEDTAARLVEAGARCIRPDLPFGSHRTPMRPDADLSPTGMARLVADLLEALDLRDVTLVGNDSGGAISQLVVTRHPERVGRVVLTPCDAFEVFPPAAFKPLLFVGGRVPGGARLLAVTTRGPVLTSPIAYGWLAKRKRRELYADWFVPARRNAGIRRDLVKALRGIDKRLTLDAAERLPGFDGPALLVWAKEDRFFKPALAHRLAERFKSARVEMVDDSYTFIPLDRPAELARLVAGFSGLGESSTSPPPPASSSSAAPATSNEKPGPATARASS